MNKREVEASLATGYTVAVTLSENGLIPAGCSFDSVEDFDAALVKALPGVGECPYTKVKFIFKTADGRITYRGCYALTATETPSLVDHVMSTADDAIEMSVHVRNLETRLNMKIGALMNKLVFAAVYSLESLLRMQVIRCEMAALAGFRPLIEA